MTLGLVVPVFDEEVRFAEHAKALVEFVAPGGVLVFVDDGSTDRTASLVSELVASTSSVDVRLLRRPHVGKGAAVAAGLASVLADDAIGYAAFCDLDLSTPLDELSRIIEAATHGEVLAIGSRDLTGSRLVQREGVVRESLGRAYNRLLQATVTPGVVDTQCGAKAASRSVWARVLPFCAQVGFAWDAEVVAVALALGVPVHEVAIEWRHDTRSKVRVGADGLAMVWQTPAIYRSVLGARSHARASDPAPKSGRGEVFEGEKADELLGADGQHWWFRGKAAFVATALARMGARTDGVLVDVGAGGGGVTTKLGWAIDRVVAVEGGHALAAHAHAVNGLATVQAGVVPLPLASGSAAVVCLLDVIEHLDDPAAALAEAARVLASAGGKLVVNVPGHAWLWSAADEHLGHHLRYDRRGLHRLLESSGFRVLWSSHVFSWLVPFVWLERRRATAQLGLDRTSFVIDRTAMVLTAVERMLLGRVALPLGTSILCVAEPVER
ncbi:MAG: hypothetical protein QOF60_1328 [Actinomycetota bacterium]|nr:hypothetical protein [Actinomycetota bacterium]